MLFIISEYRPEFGDDWPLTADKIQILDRNQEYLVDQIDPLELISHLFASGVLSARQRAAISSRGANYERSELLLEILRRKSRNDYQKVIVHLDQTNQKHVAEILRQGGGNLNSFCH